jgi:hypothetical protein
MRNGRVFSHAQISRASLGWTAEGGCPYVGHSRCDLRPGFPNRVENAEAAYGEAAYGGQGHDLGKGRAEVQPVGEQRGHGAKQTHHIEPVRNMDRDARVAEMKLEQDRHQSYGGHHHDGSQAVEGGAARKDHDEGNRGDEEARGDHRPATVGSGRIGTRVGHEEVGGRDRPIVDTSWVSGEWDY